MLWNVKQTAQYLGVSISLVYKMVNLNMLPHIRLNQCIRFHPEIIENIFREGLDKKEGSYTYIAPFNTDINFKSDRLT